MIRLFGELKNEYEVLLVAITYKKEALTGEGKKALTGEGQRQRQDPVGVGHG